MKELVCVAPDGSLEVWWKSDQWYMANAHFFQWGMGLQKEGYSPEFWGREVLGEL